MRGDVTVSVRSILLAGLVGLGLVTAYLLGRQGDAVSTPASAATQDQDTRQDRRMAMVGTGEASAVPDQISFTLTATARRLDLDDAMTASSATMRRVLAELEDHGVEKADVQTTGLSMHPEYEYHAYEPPTLVGYRVTQRARVDVDELSRGGAAIAGAVDVGGNGVRVSGIRLGISDPDRLMGQARDAAVESATAKAEQYAAATGQSLGDVVSVREIGQPAQRYQPQYAYRGVLDAAELAKALPIRAGKDDLEVRIQVVWEFE
ncbi:MAG: SIMPL domain-containing protein [Nocardioides sp.]